VRSAAVALLQCAMVIRKKEAKRNSKETNAREREERAKSDKEMT